MIGSLIERGSSSALSLRGSGRLADMGLKSSPSGMWQRLTLTEGVGRKRYVGG
jgi:hypothetical protein